MPDEISKAIIEQLQEDGRRPYSQIARTLGLSEAAVRQRVLKLTESGVIQIVAVTDPMQLGFRRQAMIGVRTTGDPRAVADKVAAFDGVDYVVLTAGTYDLLVEVVCEDDAALESLLYDQIRNIEGILTTETMVYLRLHHQLYNWGTR
jgi:Lrp/AsnC family transcriptional regulator, regulator for asnA, asnC and gidA